MPNDGLRLRAPSSAGTARPIFKGRDLLTAVSAVFRPPVVSRPLSLDIDAGSGHRATLPPLQAAAERRRTPNLPCAWLPLAVLQRELQKAWTVAAAVDGHFVFL